jgi:hypothetical protein
VILDFSDLSYYFSMCTKYIKNISDFEMRDTYNLRAIEQIHEFINYFFSKQTLYSFSNRYKTMSGFKG